MKFIYQSKTDLEKFGTKVYSLLVENFPQTFFVGGMVRNLLLKKQVTDIDIATSAHPNQVEKILRDNQIQIDSLNQKFGIEVAKREGYCVEVATLRKDLKAKSRYPAVKFISDIKTDSSRRDFTVNSLYLSVNTYRIFDFHSGLKDLNKRLIRFIGHPETRIKEDPLRILRALRFAISLNFKLEKTTFAAIKNNLGLTGTLTKSRRQKEIDKLPGQKFKKIMERILANPKLLDKYSE
jgi:tRNA nucleotidyltransferase (CCA-adding enzyme)